MELFKFKKLVGELALLDMEELIALYIEAKTGLKNPLDELPAYLRFGLSDMRDWVDNYNNKVMIAAT